MSTVLTGDGSTGLVVNSYTVPAAGDFVTGGGLQVTAQAVADDLQAAYGYLVPFANRTMTRQFRSEAFAFGTGSTWDFDLTNPSVWTDQNAPGTVAYIYFPLDVPSHSVLVGLTAEILPAGGHGGLPGTKPRLALRSVEVSTNTVSQSLQSDAPASPAAYEAQHSFTLAPTGSSAAWATSTAYVVGDFRTANARLYVCIHAGTSENSGTGPNLIDGQAILDGTAVWAYAGGTTGYVVNRRTHRHYVQFGSEGGANQTTGLQLIGLRATFAQILVGLGEQ